MACTDKVKLSVQMITYCIYWKEFRKKKEESRKSFVLHGVTPFGIIESIASEYSHLVIGMLKSPKIKRSTFTSLILSI